MRIDWTLTGCSREDERSIDRIWEANASALEARVAGLAEDAELLVGVYHQPDEPEPEWDVQAALHLPSAILAAEHMDGDLGSAFEHVVGELGRQIDGLADQTVEAARPRQGLESVLPILERHRAAGRSDAFFAFLQPALDSFEAYVGRELALLRSEGALAGGGVEAPDVLDEVLLRAWDQFDARPRAGRLELWLMKLIHEALAGCRAALQHESLEERIPLPEPEPHDTIDEDAWTEQATYPETMELADVLAGRAGLGAWDDLDVESKQMGLARLLGGLSPDQRHALVLSAAEGYEPAEIADIQDRPLDDVLADITAARDELRRQFQTDDELTDVEDRLDDPTGREARRRKG